MPDDYSGRLADPRPGQADRREIGKPHIGREGIVGLQEASPPIWSDDRDATTRPE